jgi:hypothetical protein
MVIILIFSMWTYISDASPFSGNQRLVRDMVSVIYYIVVAYYNSSDISTKLLTTLSVKLSLYLMNNRLTNLLSVIR